MFRFYYSYDLMSELEKELQEKKEIEDLKNEINNLKKEIQELEE